MKPGAQKPLRIAVLGVGFAGETHIVAWKRNPNAQVVAIFDSQKSRAELIAAKTEVPNVCESLEQILDRDYIDVVDVCTPNNAHTPAVLAALKSGRHVVCEKPLATTAAEVREMGELAGKLGLKLMTAQLHRYGAPARNLKRWIDAGNLGEAYHARVHATRRAFLPVNPGFIHKQLSGGGPCMDIGVHALDTCLWMMGFPTPVRVSGAAKTNFAKGHRIPGMWGEWDRDLFDVEDFASGFVHFENGATLSLESSWLGYHRALEDFSCEIFGTNAGVHWPEGKFVTTSGGSFVEGALVSGTAADPFAEELRDFYNCVVHDLPSPVPWTETIKVIAILEAIYQSQKESREILLSELWQPASGLGKGGPLACSEASNAIRPDCLFS